MSWRALLITCTTCGNRTSVLLNHQHLPSQCPGCRSPYPAVELVEGMGFIYVLSNPMMPSVLKIGYTERDVAERVAELSAETGVPASFVVEAYFPVINPRSDEAAVHNSLAKHRVSPKEFFSISIEEAMMEIYRVCGMWPAYLRPGLLFESPDEQKRRLAMEEERLAAEQEARRVAAIQDAQRLAAGQEARRVAAIQDAQRLATEQKAQRLAEEQRARRLVELREARQLAEEQRVPRLVVEQKEPPPARPKADAQTAQ